MFLLRPLIVLWLSFQTTSGSELVTFWHVTDFHLDLNYSEIGNVKFNCHFHTKNNKNLPKFGFSTKVECDTPYFLAQSAIKVMRDINAQPDFIIWTGDSVPHLDDKDINDEFVINTLGNLTSLFYHYFPTTKLYSVLGNHDYWPSNQLPTATNRIYQSAANLWGKYLSPIATMNLSQFGYYRQELDRPANTILLGLNTNLNYRSNRKTKGSHDPAGQFAFVESSLKDAKLNGKKVMIISHIPPGIYWSLKDPINERFVYLLAKYADIIIGSHFGHNHVDQMMLIRNVSDDNFVGWLLVAPAVNTWRGEGRNPAIRQISMDSETGDIRQLKQFWLNLTDSNLNGNDKWLEQYIIIIPEGKTFLQYVIDYYNQLKLGGKEKLLELLKRENVMSTNLACDSGCRKQHLCGMSEVTHDRYTDCYRSVSLGSSSFASYFSASLQFMCVTVFLCLTLL